MLEVSPLGKNNSCIKVIGVGGAGNNAINRLIEDQIGGVELIGINTALRDLNACNGKRVQIGKTLTKGLGAGARPEIGKQAALEGIDDISSALRGADMAIIVCGMGGGTGSGAAPVVAEKAKELGILTVGIVTKPFRFEGGIRAKNANQGIEEMEKHVDTMIVISNDRLINLTDRKVSLPDAFKLGDEVLRQTIQSITDIINITADINVDFADIRTVMTDKGVAYIGTGESSGDHKALEAIKLATENPLLDIGITGASDLIISIAGDVSIGDTNEAVNYVQQKAGENINLIFGSKFDESKKDYCSISVVATGIKEPKPPKPFVVPQIASASKPKVLVKTAELKQPEMPKSMLSTNPAATMKMPIASKPSVKPDTQIKHKSLTIPDFLKYAQRDRK